MQPPTRTEVNSMVTTLKENNKGYTQRQFDQSKRAKTIYHNVGFPNVENFKHFLRLKMANKCPITTEDVNVAKQTFGPDMGALKGKTTRQTPKPEIDNNI